MPALAPILDRLLNIFDGRGAIVREAINGHQFEAIFLAEPTKCSQCDQHIWIPYAPKCKFCRLSSHSKCLGQIRSRCVAVSNSTAAARASGKGGRSGGKDDQRGHELRETITFFGLCTSLMNPTRPGSALLCGHCGTCICTPKYHECAKCSRIFHPDCLRMLPDEPCDLGQRPIETRATRERQQVYKHTSALSIEDFEILAELGRGSFSTVYLAKLRRQNATVLNSSSNSGGGGAGCRQSYAIKAIKKTNAAIISNPKYAFAEWRALNLGRSYPFLTTAHCCFQSRDRLYFVMEHVRGRDLLWHVHQEAPFPEARARFHAGEIVLALVYLHRKHRVVFRDLKLNNIILDPYGHCKLIDFGMAKFLEPERMSTSTFSGTPYYLSPEVLAGLAYDFSVDWWALGVIMYEMLCVYQPFTGNSNEEIFEAIRTSEVNYPPEYELSDRARSILDGLLTKEPQQRLGCQLMEGCSEAIERHPFFLFKRNDTELHLWKELEAKQVKPPYVPDAGAGACAEQPKRARPPQRFSSISSKQLAEVCQDDFDGFSSYSESFVEELGGLSGARLPVLDPL